MEMGLARVLLTSVSKFVRDEGGTAAMEFVTILPLGAGILVLSAEYGNGLMTREALDSALRDATRVLSRAPLDAEVNAAGETVPKFYQFFTDEAQAMVAQRTGRKVEDVTFTATVTPIPGSENLRTPLILIETEATIGLDLPLLTFIQNFITSQGGEGESKVPTFLSINAYDRARYVGEVAVGQQACSQVDKALGLCGGPS